MKPCYPDKDIRAIRTEMVRRFGADVAQQAFLDTLELGLPITRANVLRACKQGHQARKLSKYKVCELRSPDLLYWDPREQRWVFGYEDPDPGLAH